MSLKNVNNESSHRSQVADADSSALEVALEVFTRLLADMTEDVPHLEAITRGIERLLNIEKALSLNPKPAPNRIDSIGSISCYLAEVLRGSDEDGRSAVIKGLSTDLYRYQIFLNETCETLGDWISQNSPKRFLDFAEVTAGIDQKIDLFRNAFGISRIASLPNTWDTVLYAKMYNRMHLDKWLQPADVGISQRHAADKRHAGTGLWLVRDSAEFREWIFTPASFLWLHGKSGCGKTILSSTVVDTLRDRAERFAFFYFDQHQSTVAQFLCSIVSQLSTQTPSPDKTLTALWASYIRSQHIPSNTVLLSEALIPILTEINEPVYIVLDALDECLEQEMLLHTITTIVDEKLTNVHLLVTSRPEVPRGTGLAHLATSVSLEGRMDEDIEAYVNDTLFNKLAWLGEMKTEVKRSLLEHSNGMFRLVSLQIDELRHCDERPSQVEMVLNNMPTSLRTIYDRILERIKNPDMVSGVSRTMNWLLFSERPLEVLEVIDALAFDFESEPVRFNPAKRMLPEALLASCAGLVTILEVEASEFHGPKTMITPAHSSVKEYFLAAVPPVKLGPLEISKQAAHHLIARTCIGYLCSFDHVLHPVVDRHNYPLTEYSLAYWGKHITLCDEIGLDNCGPPDKLSTHHPSLDPFPSNLLYAMLWALFKWLRFFIWVAMPIPRAVHDTHVIHDTGNPRQLIDTVLKLLQPDSPQFITLSQLYDVDLAVFQTQPVPTPALYLAATLGIGQVVCHLLEHDPNVNWQGGVHGSPLQAACFRGHIKIAIQLLKSGADVNLQDAEHGTALQVAYSQGHVELAQLLIQHGADTNLYSNVSTSRGEPDSAGTFVIYPSDHDAHSGEGSSVTTVDDVAAIQAALGSGGCVVSIHEPSKAALWIEEHWNDPLLVSIRNSGHGGPLALMLFPTTPALAMFGPPQNLFIVNAAESLAQSSGFPVLIRPSGENPTATLLTQHADAANIPRPTGHVGGDTPNNADGSDGTDIEPESFRDDTASGDLVEGEQRDRDPGYEGFNQDTEQMGTFHAHPYHGRPRQGDSGGGDGGDGGGGPTGTHDKWESHLHRTRLKLRLKANSTDTYPINIGYSFKFTINRETELPIDLQNMARPLSQPEVMALVDFKIETRRHETQVDRSYANIGFVAHRQESIMDREFLNRGFEAPDQIYKLGQQRQIQKGIKAVLGFSSGSPLATAALSYDRSHGSTLEATDSKVMPRCRVDYEIGDEWDEEKQSYTSYNLAYQPQDIRLDHQRQEARPLEVKVGMGINLRPSGTEAPIPPISFVNRNQFLIWVSDPTTKAKIRGIVVVTSSFLGDIQTEKRLSVYEQMETDLTSAGVSSEPETKSEKHKSGVISLSIAKVQIPGSSNLKKSTVPAFFARFGQRSSPTPVAFIASHEYLARGWDAKTNHWRSVLWPALDQQFRAADIERTSPVWKIQWKRELREEKTIGETHTDNTVIGTVSIRKMAHNAEMNPSPPTK
ncbi:hypothetical protein C8R43DRAFT_5507 [Mycena crocata]|nr:hypothetical protein C8R43DRAFT_5507 [Mycena crocata]